jgi:hypothetical protein
MHRSISRFASIALTAGVLFVAGCGGRRPVTFATAIQDLAKQVSADLGKKDEKALARDVTAVERYLANGKADQEQVDAIKWAVEEGKKGNWDAAKKYIDQCIEGSKI